MSRIFYRLTFVCQFSEAEDESNGNDGEAQCSIPLFEQSKNDNPIAPSIDEANDTVPPAEALALSIKLIGNAESK